MKRLAIVLFVITLASAAFRGSFLLAETPAPPVIVDSSPFAGKVIIFYTGKPSKEDSPYVLIDAAFQLIGGRQFVVGKGAGSQHPDDWTAGVKTCIAWSEVTSFMEFTPEEYKEFCGKAAAARNGA